MSITRKQARALGSDRVDGASLFALGNPVIYLSALDPYGNGTVPANGTPLPSWRDMAANADRTFTASPTWYAAASPNGHPAVNFTANASQSTAVTGLSVAAPLTVYVVAKVLNTTDGNLASINGTAGYVYKRSSTWRLFSSATAIASASEDENWHVFTFAMDGASSLIRIDGAQVASGTLTNTTITTFTINGGTYPLDGYIAALALFTGIPDHAAVEAILGDRFGITVA